MSRSWEALGLAVALSGCLPAPAPPAFGDPALARRLPALARTFGTPRARSAPALLRYEVTTHDGIWEREIVVGGGRYAERRRRKDGPTYAFGEDGAGPWLRVGDAPARWADDGWRAEARTQRALFDLAFLSPGPRDRASFLGASSGEWELGFLPQGGSSLVFVIARATAQPHALDVHDAQGRLTACDDVRWTMRHGRTLPSVVTCTTAVGRRVNAARARFRLVSASPLAELPAWVPKTARPRTPVLRQAVVIPQQDVRRPYLDLRAPAGGLTRLVVDTGATHTVLDARAARRLGVVPTGEAPMAFEPPWLPDHVSWMGVADRLTIGGATLDGARVMVTERFADFLEDP